MDQRISSRKMPVGLRLVPHPVKPHATDLAVVRQELAKLSVHEIQVRFPVAGFGPSGMAPGAPARKIVRRMPIQLRVVEKQFDALFAAFRREQANDVFPIGRARHHVPIRQARTKHRKSIVMFRRNGDVLHACGLRQCNPCRRIKFDGIEEAGQLRIFRSADGPCLHHPFTVSQHAVHAPMNEHAELRVLEPLARLQVGR
jgi:hypothetical protein